MRQVKLVDAPGGVAKTFDEHAREPFGLRSAFPDIQPAVRRARLRRAWGIRKIDSNLLEQFGIGFIFLVRITRWLSHRVNAHQESPLLWGKVVRLPIKQAHGIEEDDRRAVDNSNRNVFPRATRLCDPAPARRLMAAQTRSNRPMFVSSAHALK